MSKHSLPHRSGPRPQPRLSGQLARACRASLVAAAALAGCQDPSRPTGPAPTELRPRASAAGGLEDRYIVVFKEGVADPRGLADQLVRENAGTLHYAYHAALKGFAATLPPQAVGVLRNNANVANVVADAATTGDSDQSNPPVGLDRIDQRNLPLDLNYHSVRTGVGVNAYILDTGIFYAHQDFGGRAHFGTDVFENELNTGGADCNGHGTSVASIVGGATYGVAKQVNLVSVRVLGCSNTGTISGAIAGVDWVTANAQHPAVANMSLSVTLDTTGASALLETAVRNSIASGVSYSLSAGNSKIDACTISPGKVTEGMTTGWTVSGDQMADISGYGSCVDWFAPGSGILAATWTSDGSTTASANRFGASFAVPHTTGVAALYLEANPQASASEVQEALRAAVTPNAVTGVPSGPNGMLYSLGDWTAPTASIASPTTGTRVERGGTVTFQGSATDFEDGALPATSLVWTSDIDGQIGTGASFTRSDLSAGVHTITLTATDSGNRMGTASVSLTVNSKPVASISAPASGLTVTQGNSITFQGSATDAEDGALSGASLVWTSSIDAQIGTGTSVITNSLSPGDHTITLTATDAAGSTGTASISLTINARPTASISAPASGTTVDQGTSVTFQGSATDPEEGPLSGASLVWTSSIDGQLGTGTPVSTSNLSPGTHTITLTASDSHGAFGRATISLTVNAPPTATISKPAPGSVVAQGTSVTFQGSAKDPEDGPLSGASLVWSSSLDGQIGTGGRFSTRTLSAGTHTITLTAKDSHGLAGTATISIVVTGVANSAPTASFSDSCSNSATCAFTDRSSDRDGTVVGWSWTFGDGKTSTARNPTNTYTTEGTYTVRLVVTDDDGATSAAAQDKIVCSTKGGRLVCK